MILKALSMKEGAICIKIMTLFMLLWVMSRPKMISQTSNYTCYMPALKVQTITSKLHTVKVLLFVGYKFSRFSLIDQTTKFDSQCIVDFHWWVYSKLRNHEFKNLRNCVSSPIHENWYPSIKVLSQYIIFDRALLAIHVFFPIQV